VEALARKRLSTVMVRTDFTKFHLALLTQYRHTVPVELHRLDQPPREISTQVMTVEEKPDMTTTATMNDHNEDTSTQTLSDELHSSEYTCTINFSRDVSCQITPPQTPAQSSVFGTYPERRTISSRSSHTMHGWFNFKRETFQEPLDRKNQALRDAGLPPMPPVPTPPVSVSTSTLAVKKKTLKRHKSLSSLAIGKLSQACRSTLALPIFGQHGDHKEKEVAKIPNLAKKKSVPNLAKKKSFFGRPFGSWGKSSPDLSIETTVRPSTPTPPSDDSTIEDDDPEDEPLYAEILLPSRRSLWVKLNGIPNSSNLWLLRPVNNQHVQTHNSDSDSDSSDTDSFETALALKTQPRRPHRPYFNSRKPKVIQWRGKPPPSIDSRLSRDMDWLGSPCLRSKVTPDRQVSCIPIRA
jgi:hypothetical protein